MQTFKQYLTEKSNRIGKIGRIPVIQLDRDFNYENDSTGKITGVPGTFATAFNHPKSGNSVVKVVNMEDPQLDGQVALINLALANQNNPFFPRIHNAKIYKLPQEDRYGASYRMIVNMERLRHMGIASIAGENKGTNNLTDASKHLLQMIGLQSGDIANKFKIGVFLSNSNNRKYVREYSKNPQFVEAMNKMEPYFKKFHADLHGDNIMVRLTGSGPQLVLMDPFGVETDAYRKDF